MQDSTQRAVDEGWCDCGSCRMSGECKNVVFSMPGPQCIKALDMGAEWERDVKSKRDGVMVCARESAVIVKMCMEFQRSGKWVFDDNPAHDDRVVWELDIPEAKG